MHTKMQAARLLGLDSRVLTKCMRYANVSAARSPHDARKQLLSDEQIEEIRRAHVALYGQPPFGDLVARVEVLERLVKERTVRRLEALAGDTPATTRTPVTPPRIPALPPYEPPPYLPPTPDPVPVPQYTPRLRGASATRPLPKQHERVDVPLPGDLVAWRPFAELHSVPETTVRNAVGSGKLTFIEGEGRGWKHDNFYVKQALDAAGRAQFFRIWGHRKGFKRCPECPHLLPEEEIR